MRGQSENDERSGAGGGTGRASARGLRSGMRAGFRPDQARSEEEGGGQRPAGQARGEEEGRRSTAARPEDGEVADIRDVALGVGVKGTRRTDHGGTGSPTTENAVKRKFNFRELSFHTLG